MANPNTDEKMPAPLTAARLGGTSPLILEHMLTPRLERDREFLPEHLNVDMAHSIMLVEQGILDPGRGAQLLMALRDARNGGPTEFPINPEFDSMVLQVEHYLTDRLGDDVAGRMHVGRSRIDHNPAVQRLAARNRLLLVHRRLLRLVEVITGLARRHKGTVMPGWTHLQHAQPWTLGHYLLRQHAVLIRCLDRLTEAYPRINQSSLGGAALVGTSWPLDRNRVAELLGHGSVVENAHDAGEFTLDWVSEYAATLSITLVELGRLASDLYIWSSWEFGLVELDNSLCGTSSIMPQKKNAIVLEHIRAHAGKSIGWFASSAGIARSTSSTDVDPAYGGSIVSEAGDTTWRCADLMSNVLETMQINETEMRRRAGIHWSTASGLADELARQFDLPFRSTHHVVANLVRECIAAGVEPSGVTGELLRAAAKEVIEEDLDVDTAWVQKQLEPEEFLRSRVTAGSTNPEDMERQLDRADAGLSRHHKWSEAQHLTVNNAQQLLDKTADRLITEHA